MHLVYLLSKIPAEYEVDSLLKPVEHDFSTVDESLYQLHFGQFPERCSDATPLLLPVSAEIVGNDMQGAYRNVAMWSY